MSVATNNILKLLRELSESADKILSDQLKLPPLSEWTSIVETKADNIVESESTPNADSEIPTLMSYLLVGGTGDRGPRASTMLTDIQRRHLHGSGKDSFKSFRSRPQSSIRKTPSGRKSKASMPAESNTPKLKVPPTIIKKTTSSIFEIKKMNVQPFTPSVVILDDSATPPVLKDRSSKRKSSAELSLESVKKAKIRAIYSPTVERKINPMKAKNSSQLSYANVSATTTNTVLRENFRTLRSKIESKQDTALQNRKNIMDLRQQKLEESKKRETAEKMEKSTQQVRIKLEKQKREKNKTPKAVLKNSVKPIDKETSLSAKKLPVKMSPKQIGTGILKSNQKAFLGGVKEKKNQKHGDIKMLNTTFAIEGPSSSSKGKTLKEAKIVFEGKKNQPQKQPTLTEKKGPESYAITPARSSFVSYDISEIRSDSEGEDQESNTKPVPSWATGVRLRNAVLQQHHNPIDTDELFGNVFETLDLAMIMGVKKKHYNKRTSSAVWNSSFSFS